MGNPYAPPGENPPSEPQPDAPENGGPAPWPQDAGGGPAPWPHESGGAPGGDAGSPGRAPDPERPSPQTSEAARATSRRVLHFLALMLAAVLTGALPLPWQVASALFVVAAIVVGVRALVLAWRSGLRGGLVVMLAVGVGVAGFVCLGMLSLLALWPQQMARQDCLARAVTISATRTCEVEFQRAVEERLGRAVEPTDA